MFRLALFAIAALLLFTPSVGRAAPEASRPKGFKVFTVAGRIPGQTVVFRDEEATRLVSEVMPIIADNVNVVLVREQAVNSGNMYWGLIIDIALDVTVENAICEERHVVAIFAHKGGPVHSIDAPTVINHGQVSDHGLISFGWQNKYYTLPEKLVSNDVALASCRALAADTSNWQQASNLNDYSAQTFRRSALIKAIETLAVSRIRCLDPEEKPCTFERSELLSLIQTAAPKKIQCGRHPG